MWSCGSHYITCDRFKLSYGPRDAVRCKSRALGMTPVIDDSPYYNVYGHPYYWNAAGWSALGFGSFLSNDSIFYCYHLNGMQNPTKFIAITDAVSSSNGNSMFCFYPLSGAGAAGVIATFHNNVNNSGFMDGHVESARPNKFSFTQGGYNYIPAYINDSNIAVTIL